MGGKTNNKKVAIDSNTSGKEKGARTKKDETHLDLVEPIKGKSSFKDILAEMKEQNSFKVYKEL